MTASDAGATDQVDLAGLRPNGHQRPAEGSLPTSAPPTASYAPDAARQAGGLGASETGAAGAIPAPGRRERFAALRATALPVLVVAGAGVLLGGAAGAGYHLAKPPAYSASIAILVTGSSASVLDPTANASPDQRDVATRAELLGSALVEARAQSTLGRKPPHLSVTSRSDSQIITAGAVDSSAARASADVDAYVAAYESVLADQQRQALLGERARLTVLQASTARSLTQLDQRADEAPETRRALVLQAQTPQRTALVTANEDASGRLSRITGALQSLPATTQRLNASPVTENAATGWAFDVGTGLAAGIAVAALALLRRYRDELFGRA